MSSSQTKVLGRSGNPVLRNNTFEKEAISYSGSTMTIQGTVNKTIILLLLVIASAALSWYYISTSNSILINYIMPVMIILLIGGLAVALITIFNKKASPITAPIYTVIEGLFLGIFSLFFEKMYPGIVLQAVFLTFGILFSLLLAYKSGLIKVTQNFRLGVVAATGGIFLIYLVNFILRFFKISIPFIHEGGMLGIIFSVFVLIIASLNLVLDFDFIERGSEEGAPKYMEWYGAFGLMVTLIWLYIEILSLLSKSRRK